MRYLTVDDIIELHESEVGSTPVDFGLLESAVLRPHATIGNQDAYASIHEKAAALFESLVQNHAFLDGNKRTAVLAVVVLYRLNGYIFGAEDTELVALALDVAGHRVELTGIAKRLEHAVQLDPSV